MTPGWAGPEARPALVLPKLRSLAAHVHFAQVDNHIVCLDVERGSYGCLVDGALVARLGGNGGVFFARPEVEAAFAENGLLGPAGSSARPSPAALPHRALVVSRHVRRRTMVRVWSSAWEALTLTRLRSFRELIDIAQAWPTRRRETDEIAADIAAFEAVQPWLPAQGLCLQRSFLLHRLLADDRTRWTFGVRLWPFSAHCWLQRDDLVLADDVERVRGYTPILTL